MRHSSSTISVAFSTSSSLALPCAADDRLNAQTCLDLFKTLRIALGTRAHFLWTWLNEPQAEVKKAVMWAVSDESSTSCEICGIGGWDTSFRRLGHLIYVWTRYSFKILWALLRENSRIGIFDLPVSCHHLAPLRSPCGINLSYGKSPNILEGFLPQSDPIACPLRIKIFRRSISITNCKWITPLILAYF
jgi:hypothetical protein